MNWLLNISTHGSDLDIAGPNWSKAASLLRRTGMDGFELYPAGAYDCTAIPKEIVGGIHLCFFVMLRQIWRDDREGLLRIFDSGTAGPRYAPSRSASSTARKPCATTTAG